MGTSKSYGGPTGNNPLLPPWAPPPPDILDPDSSFPDQNGDQHNNGNDQKDSSPPTPAWSIPKSQFTRFVTSGGGASNAKYLRNSARGFVRSQGGARNAARSAVAGRRSTRRLGRVLSFASGHSIAETAAEFNISFVGQTVESFLAALVDFIAPAGNTNEDAVARRAVTETLCILFEELSVEEQGMDVLSHLDESMIGDTIEIYISSYIGDRLMEVLAVKLETRSDSTSDACRIEREVKEYISERVKLEFASRNLSNVRWLEAEGERIAQQLFTEGYELIESWQ